MNGLNHFLRVGKDDWRNNNDYSSIYEIDKSALAEIISWATNLKNIN